MKLRAALVLTTCLLSSSCNTPNARFCDATHACSDPAFPVCNLTASECEASNADGGGGGDLGPKCVFSEECTVATMPVCDVHAGCRACVAGDDAACSMHSPLTPRCKLSGSNVGSCVACARNSDCTGAGIPVCGEDGACRACASHTECASGICVFDGTNAGDCAQASQVALVDNGGNAVAACQTMRTQRDGNSKATAYCDVTEVVSEAAKRPFVIVAGSAKPYSAISLKDRNFTLVGPGKNAVPTARLFSTGATSVDVSITGTAQVVVDGLDLGGDNFSKAVRGLSCLNGAVSPANATAVLRNSTVSDCGDEGVVGSTCTMIVDANQITGNQGGGVTLSASTYTVTNNIIANNGATDFPGVSLTGNSTGAFAFNTVVKNHVAAGIGGIDCGTGVMKVIATSIVFGNDVDSGSQLGPKCMLSSVVTGKSDSQGIMLDPVFAGPSDFHLKLGDPANVACCVDKIATDPKTYGSAHDVDFTARPKGAGWDIGAHELQ